MGGYVYLLGEGGNNRLYKIGVTTGDIDKRIRQLQTGNGNQIKLIDSFYSSKPFRLEKMIHNKYQFDRVEGEWFLLSKEIESRFHEDCLFYENIIASLKDNPFF